MCCFSGPVKLVSDTQIFARGRGDRQVVVYSMRYGAANELAMVLPIPVPAGSRADAVRFISLEGCPDFFDHLSRGFPEELWLGGDELDEATATQTLEVHEVGAYEASFVPSPADFGRLDERFRLPVPIWLVLGNYRDWGFAVFKLKAASLAAVHPMAFDFPRRDTTRLFFPTLHLHGNSFHKAAMFDHTLYCQPEPGLEAHLAGWARSDDPVRSFMRCKEAAALVDLDLPCARVQLFSFLENRDTWVGRDCRLPVRPSPAELRQAWNDGLEP
jgi:hypothetical protein